MDSNVMTWDHCIVIFAMFNDLITIDWHFDDWEEKQNLYIFGMNWTPLYMSNINILQFHEDHQPGEWRKLYHSARKRSANEHSQSWRTL